MADVDRPDPRIIGSGTANYAGRISELRRRQKEAASRDDWTTVDSIEAQIRQLEAERYSGAQK
jgi:hypothetical protein